MNNVLSFPNPAPPVDATEAATPPPSQAEAFGERCLDAFVARGLSKGYTSLYLSNACHQVRKFLEWSGKDLTTATEGDFESWSRHLRIERKLARATQRTYQNAIRVIFSFVAQRTELQNECHAQFGRRVILVAHEDNCVTHTVEDDSEHKLPPMTEEEINRFFASMDDRIERAEIEAPRTVRALERDKALFYTIYISGIRASECAALTVHDFRPSTDIPEMGKYAYINVTAGKASKGSGARQRQVLLTHIDYIAVIEWYLINFRPQYTPKPHAPHALFYSERGNQISLSSIDERFKLHLKASGIDSHEYTPHSLRRSMVTHEIMRSGTEFARNKAGHGSSSVTQIYGQVPMEHYRLTARNLVRQQIKDIGTKAP